MRNCVPAALLVWVSVAFGQPASDLTALSLEDFMSVEVTSVDRTAQKLAHTPAAVFVITQDDIRRSGATVLPEVLRLAPGLTVSRMAAGVWAVGVRGFANIHSDKLLVMIDGRTIYSPLFSGTIWSANMIALDDIERIEVIRGPGGTIWGANAVSGVISVITKKARDTQGGALSVTAGSFNPLITSLRYGGGNDEGKAWRAWGMYGRYGSPPVPGLGRLDNWQNVRGGARLEWQTSKANQFTFEGEVLRNSMPTPYYSSRATSGAFNLFDTWANALSTVLRWEHESARGDHSTVQVFGTSEHSYAGYFGYRIRTADVSWHYSTQRGAHLLVFGAGARVNSVSTWGSEDFSFAPAEAVYAIGNAFLQDEWELWRNRLFLTAGAKIERYSQAGSSLQPTVRLMWTPSSRWSAWMGVSRAVRTPAHTDFAMQIPVRMPDLPFEVLVQGNLKFKPETLYAFEAGTRFQLGRKWGVDVATFRNEYRQLYGYAMLPLTAEELAAMLRGQPIRIRATLQPSMSARHQGVEAVLRYDLRPWWRTNASYTSLFRRTYYWTGYQAATSFVIPDQTPKHQGLFRSSWDMGSKWNLDLALYHYEPSPDRMIARRQRLDLRVGRKFGENAEFSLIGQDLLRAHTLEYAGPILWPNGLATRSVNAALTWRF